VATTLTSGSDKLSVKVEGFLPLDPMQFRFAFTGAPGDSIARIVLDSTGQGVSFGDNADQFLVGPTNLRVSDILYQNNSGLSPVATLDFQHHAFNNGGSVDLGFDIDNTLVGFLGINSGLLYGAKVTATIQSGKTSRVVSGRLLGPTGRAYAVNDGFGLIDAFAAYQKLKGH
jgi:hypothetical protein